MKATKEDLEALHGAMAKALLDRIRDGSATAADLGVARQLLKDNGIDAIAKPGSPLAGIRDSLPFPDAAGVEQENSYN
jgi:hypothetical protein